MNENEPVLREEWFVSESISDGIYKKLKYRKIEQVGFYIRPAQEWFYPCPECQKRLRKILGEARWILGNKSYEPPIELNNVKDEIDEGSWITLDEHKATPEEIKRIGKDGWRDVDE